MNISIFQGQKPNETYIISNFSTQETQNTLPLNISCMNWAH